MINAWIHAFRLRTLPLAASGIICGIALAFQQGSQNYLAAIMALLTAFSLQILSNLANDLGDFEKGTDNDARVGPGRSMQLGLITRPQMLGAIKMVAVISFLLGFSLLVLCLHKENLIAFMLFLLLGLFAIAAAYKYTVGKGAYGYRGLGDLVVFLFFGMASVVGCGFLLLGELHNSFWWAGLAMGGFSTAVLNTNNMRDILNDADNGKITLPVRFGLPWARNYHLMLLLGPFVVLPFLASSTSCIWFYLPLILIIPVVRILRKVNTTSEHALFDPLLKPTALLALAYSLLLSLATVLC